MKKLLSLLLALVIVFCLAACNAEVQVNTNSSEESSSLAEEVSSEENSSETKEMSSEPVSSEEVSSEESSSEVVESSKPAESSKPTESSAPEHTHTFSKATCTEAAKCSCGATNGKALGHNFSAATCTAPKKCKNCGITEGAALGHKFSAATCTTKKTCSVCKVTEGNLASHKYENGVCTVCKAIDEKTYVAEQIKAAEKVFTDYTKYEAALKIIKAALQKFPENSDLEAKRDYYQSFAPVYLSDIEPYTHSVWFARKDTDKDVFSNERQHCVRIEANFESADGTYDLAGKYNNFKATVYGLGDGDFGSLKIYGDGVCIYSNTNIDVNTRGIDIELDVTGIMDLKIEMYQEISWIGECFGLSEILIQKTVI